MGWLELRAWVGATNRLRSQGAPDPHRWTEASRRNFAELDAKRRKLRGGG